MKIFEIIKYKNSRYKFYFCSIPIFSYKKQNFKASLNFLRNEIEENRKQDMLRINDMMSNIKYELYDDIVSQQLQFPIVKSKDELLNILIHSNKSLARFGDGEYRNMIDSGPGFQQFNEKLQLRLIEIIKNNNDNLLIGITDIFKSLDTFTDEVKYSWREFLHKYRSLIYQFINFQSVYYDSFITRPYISYKDKSTSANFFEKIKSIWEDKSIIIVEGEGSRLGIGNDLFKNTNSIKRILCPPENAFDVYDDILRMCMNQNKNELFLLALGPTATVLAFDLHNAGYRAIDIGHIDIEYEWFLKKTTSKTPIHNKYVCSNEVESGQNFEPLLDSEYLNQIIGMIK